MQGVWVRSPVRELRYHLAQSQNIKQKQCCNKFNKDFLKKKKKVHIKNILKIKTK